MSPAHLTDQLDELRRHRVMSYTQDERHAYLRGQFYGASAPEDGSIRWFQEGMWRTPRRFRPVFQAGYVEAVTE